MFAIAIATATWSGCAQWKSEPPPELARGGLPPAQVADEVAILEVAFVRLPEASPALPETPGAASFVDRLDETVVPGEMRERLATNGIRVGRLLTIEPGQMGEAAPADEATRLMEEANVVSDFEQRRRRISCRDGQPYTLAVRRPSGERVSTLIRTSEGVVGKSLSDPQFMLILRTRMLDDGRLAVRLTPEVQHGEVRQNYVSSDLAIRMEFQRDQWTLHELMCEVPLSEGQAIVLMPQKEAFGLGKQMFVGERADLSQERIAVVLRLQRRPQHGLGS
ncbi:hypothetical protein [Candidatus Laterigemmans baculatus]|uniref:hypothetical protein n=1 Tax=Candidatus Laterigemmans baculatus TaxID=2770505 RepID=UPI0013DA2D2B|nr:hypothetical protein [Candidatus Laterigemmans baculatus]